MFDFLTDIKNTGEWTLFLDRDGTINRRIVGDYVKTWDDFALLEGVTEALRHFSECFRHIIIVTNQMGIGKGLMTHERLEEIHQKMLALFQRNQIFIDQIYYCPELAIYDPPCRKPNPGMAVQAQNDFPDIDFSKSLMVGDGLSDMHFGKRLNMKTVWLRHDVDEPKPLTNDYDFALNSLSELSLYLQSA